MSWIWERKNGCAREEGTIGANHEVLRRTLRQGGVVDFERHRCQNIDGEHEGCSLTREGAVVSTVVELAFRGIGSQGLRHRRKARRMLPGLRGPPVETLVESALDGKLRSQGVSELPRNVKRTGVDGDDV